MHSIASPLLWTTFLTICGLLLIFDLAVLNRGAKVISARAALRNWNAPEFRFTGLGFRPARSVTT